ncbi:MAG: hypothetical protein Ct9H300mP19_17880 [Dehalococcoidia bacterium]|nr:MAG: hypothetical protein Ct9H300mP19_17880 [Dehalococcoidia bacterium]
MVDENEIVDAYLRWRVRRVFFVNHPLLRRLPVTEATELDVDLPGKQLFVFLPVRG